MTFFAGMGVDGGKGSVWGRVGNTPEGETMGVPRGPPALSQKADPRPCGHLERKEMLGQGLGGRPVGPFLTQEFSTCVPTGCMNVGARPRPAEPKCIHQLLLEVKMRERRNGRRGGEGLEV